MICNGTGDNGGHCCWIEGEVCEFLDTKAVRCTVWHIFDRNDPDEVTRLAWKRAPVGKWFAKNHPGFTCRDWPQNIPDVPNLCCWSN